MAEDLVEQRPVGETGQYIVTGLVLGRRQHCGGPCQGSADLVRLPQVQGGDDHG
jgi:hypothetical protein